VAGLQEVPEFSGSEARGGVRIEIWALGVAGLSRGLRPNPRAVELNFIKEITFAGTNGNEQQPLRKQKRKKKISPKPGTLFAAFNSSHRRKKNSSTERITGAINH